MAAEFQFADMLIAEDGNYALGIERTTGRHYLSVEMSEDGLMGEEAHFEISEEEFMRLLEDPDGAKEFARLCRAGEMRGRAFGGAL